MRAAISSLDYLRTLVLRLPARELLLGTQYWTTNRLTFGSKRFSWAWEEYDKNSRECYISEPAVVGAGLQNLIPPYVRQHDVDFYCLLDLLLLCYLRKKVARGGS